MPKDTFWFSHDYNSRTDKELLRVRMKYNMQGVGIFWCIVEMLYEENGYLMLSECERIAFELHTECDCIKDIITSFQLFKNDGEKFWSETALERLTIRKNKSETASKSALKKWDDLTFSTNAMRTHNGRNAIKEKNNKEKNIYNVEECGENQKKVKFEIVGLGELEISFFTNVERWQIRELFHFIVNSQREFETIAMTKPFMKTVENFQIGLQAFVNGVQEKGEYEETARIKGHFVNWLNSQNGSLEKVIAAMKKKSGSGQPKIILK